MVKIIKNAFTHKIQHARNMILGERQRMAIVMEKDASSTTS